MEAANVDLALLRLKRSKSELDNAKSYYNNEQLTNFIADRVYLAVYHGMKAALALDGIETDRQNRTISEFNRLYIKTGTFPAEYSIMIENLKRLSFASNNDPFYKSDKKELNTQIQNAEAIIASIEAHVIKRTRAANESENLILPAPDSGRK